MKNKKAIIIVVLLIVVVLLAGMIVAAIKNKNLKDENDNKNTIPKRFVITYSYGGGFTTYANSLTRAISIDQDGKVTIELDIEDPLVEPLEYSIGKDKAKELMKFFVDNKFDKVKKDLSQNDVTDLNSSYLEVKSDTINRKVGGYAASINDKFRKYSHKFMSYIDENKLNEFNNKVTKAYEKSND